MLCGKRLNRLDIGICFPFASRRGIFFVFAFDRMIVRRLPAYTRTTPTPPCTQRESIHNGFSKLKLNSSIIDYKIIRASRSARPSRPSNRLLYETRRVCVRCVMCAICIYVYICNVCMHVACLYMLASKFDNWKHSLAAHYIDYVELHGRMIFFYGKRRFILLKIYQQHVLKPFGNVYF